MSSKITENNLTKMIKESIVKHLSKLNESANYLYDGKNFYSDGTMASVLDEVMGEVEKYQNFAQQLQAAISNLQKIGENIVDMLNYNFNLGVRSIDNFDRCELDDNTLIINVDIPTQNFAEACKRSSGVMEVFNEEAGEHDLDHLVSCGRYCNWDDLYTSDGASLGDGMHKVEFKPVTYTGIRNDNLEVGNSVPCQITISNALLV